MNSEELRNLLYDRYQKLSNKLIPAIAGITIALFLLISLLALLFEGIFYLPWQVKSLIWIGAISAAGVTAYILYHRYRPETFTDFYRSFTAHHNLSNVRYALDLQDNARGDRSNLREFALRQNLSDLDTALVSEKLREYTGRHRITKLSFIGNTSLIATLLLTVMPLMWATDTSQRYLSFWQDFEPPIPYEFTVEPGDASIEQGSPFEVRIRFDGSVPEDFNLAMRTEVESDYRRRGFEDSGNGVFAAPAVELFNDLHYYIEMDGYESERYFVEVHDLPRFRELNVDVIPPQYTGLESESVTYPFSRVEAFPGSTIEITAHTNKPLEEAQLLSGASGDSLDLTRDEANDSLYTASLEIMNPDSARFYLTDGYGLENSNPYEFDIETRQDQPPSAEILFPEEDLTLTRAAPVEVIYEINDDFGFSGVTLQYEHRQAYVDEPNTGSVTLPTPTGSEATDEHMLELEELQMGSMDELTYWIEVSDNNYVEGPQTTRSARQTITIQSLAEQLMDQDEQEEDISRSFDDIQDQYSQFRETMEQLRREIRDNPEDEWEQSQVLDQMQEEREDLEREVEDLQEEFKNLSEQLEQSGNLSEETRDMYNELRNLIDEIDDPELLEQLQEFRENLGNMDQTELREMLEQFEFDEDRFRDRLERTVDLFKQLRLNSDLDQMSEMFDELSRREDDILESEEFGDEELRQQESIREEMEDLSERFQQMSDDIPEQSRDAMEQLREELSPEMENVQEELDQNIDGMQQEEPDEDQLRQQQERIRDQMEQMSQTFADTREAMQQEQIEVNIASLKNILGGLIRLSTSQERLTRETAELSDNSPAFVGQARQQRNIGEQFTRFADSLRQVASEVPQFPNQVSDRQREAQRYIERSTDYLVERDGSNASSAGRNALGNLNQLSSMVADLLDQLENQAGGGGGGQMSMQQMMEQMQDLSGDQQELNQQIQDFINDVQGERLSQDELERLEQIAEQQRQIREQMRELQRRGALDPGDELMSEMERMSEDMEETIRDLRGGETDEILIERQQNILSRMLETEESMQQRDEDEDERAGETAEDYDPAETADFTVEELRQYLRSGIREAEQTRFSEDYQRLIEAYFRLLEEEMEGELPEEQ